MKRIASIDILRAITMVMMLWVNDFASVEGLPHWLHHAATEEDMMGFSDLVFPSFLFCVGLSLPIALDGRFRKGHSLIQVISHIVSRSFALILMGLLSLNCSGIEGGLSGQAFRLLMVAGYFLVWNVYPRSESGKGRLFTALRILGGVILAGLIVYRYAFGHPLKVGYWGILGLIGWAYLLCSVFYLLCRRNAGLCSLAWFLITGLMIAFQSGVQWLGFYPGGWTHPTLVFSGVMASVLYARFADSRKPLGYIGILVCGALLMAGAAKLSHNFWICSKNLATPTWAFMCLSLFPLLLAALYWICDVRGWTKWALPVKPAGTATLTCYMLPTVWYALKVIIDWNYPAVLCQGLPGLVRSLAFAFLMVLCTWALGKLNIKLKL